jgi:transposase-like protein
MSAGHGAKLNRKKEQAIAALLSCPTIGEAARATGISESTLLRWLQQGEFQTHYRDARREAIGQAIANLQKASSEAVKTLQDVMQDTTAPAPARVSAAKIILDGAIKAVELEDLASRVEELERFAEEVRGAQ